MSIIICKRKTHKEKLINKEKEVEKEERAIEKKRNRRRALIPYFHSFINIIFHVISCLDSDGPTKKWEIIIEISEIF